MPRSVFNIGEAFPADDPVARFVAVLGMISNDANRSLEQFLEIQDSDADARGRRVALVRQQASAFYEAALFIGESTRRFPDVKAFVSGLPQEVQDDCARVAEGIKPGSPHYISDWLENHRNVTFHYSEMHPDKAAHGQEEIKQALEDAAELEGSVTFDDERGSARFGFADEIAAQWLPWLESDEGKNTITRLREALLSLIDFTRRAFVAYIGLRSPDTFRLQP
jgi:hypothetical protein